MPGMPVFPVDQCCVVLQGAPQNFPPHPPLFYVLDISKITLLKFHVAYNTREESSLPWQQEVFLFHESCYLDLYPVSCNPAYPTKLYWHAKSYTNTKADNFYVTVYDVAIKYLVQHACCSPGHTNGPRLSWTDHTSMYWVWTVPHYTVVRQQSST